MASLHDLRDSPAPPLHARSPAAPDRPTPIRDTHPAHTPAWLIAIITFGVVGLLAAGAWLQHRLGNGAAASAQTARLDLPTDRCPAPRPGQVLHITIAGPDAPDEAMPLQCLTVQQK